MASFYTIMGKMMGPYSRMATIIFLVILFLLVGYYGYNRFYVKSSEKYTNVANANVRNPEIVIFFFHVDWCPFCVKSKPEWTAFSAEYDGKIINNYLISCQIINCSNNPDVPDPTAAQLMATYDVNSFPTVILVKDNNAIAYDAKIKKDTLESFVISATSS